MSDARSFLSDALPELQTAYGSLEAGAAAQGISIDVMDTRQTMGTMVSVVRSESDTAQVLAIRQNDFNAAVRAGQVPADTTLQAFRPVAPYGHSFHNFGAAVDVDIVARPGGMTADQAYRVLGSLASSCGLRWGGTFTNPDPAHFELDVSLARAHAMWDSWQASGETDSSLSNVQELEVAAESPSVWAFVAGVLFLLLGGRDLLQRRSA